MNDLEKNILIENNLNIGFLLEDLYYSLKNENDFEFWNIVKKLFRYGDVDFFNFVLNKQKEDDKQGLYDNLVNFGFETISWYYIDDLSINKELKKDLELSYICKNLMINLNLIDKHPGEVDFWFNFLKEKHKEELLTLRLTFLYNTKGEFTPEIIENFKTTVENYISNEKIKKDQLGYIILKDFML